MSTKTKTLAESINDARANFGAIKKSADNPYFNSKYAELSEILEAVIPALTKEGILLTQPIIDGCVYTRLTKGDECIESSLPLPQIQDPQKIGSAITYYRRYTLSSILALAAEDDDGNTASNAAPKAPIQRKVQSTPAKTTSIKKDGEQVKYELKKNEVPESYIYNLASIVNDPDKYDKVVSYLEGVDNWEMGKDYRLVSLNELPKLKNYRVEE